MSVHMSCICVHTRMFVHVCVCVHVPCMCMSVHVLYVCMCVRTLACMWHVCVHACVHVSCMCLCIRAMPLCMSVHVSCVCTCACGNVCTCVCVHVMHMYVCTSCVCMSARVVCVHVMHVCTHHAYVCVHVMCACMSVCTCCACLCVCRVWSVRLWLRRREHGMMCSGFTVSTFLLSSLCLLRDRGGRYHWLVLQRPCVMVSQPDSREATAGPSLTRCCSLGLFLRAGRVVITTDDSRTRGRFSYRTAEETEVQREG